MTTHRKSKLFEAKKSMYIKNSVVICLYNGWPIFILVWFIYIDITRLLTSTCGGSVSVCIKRVAISVNRDTKLKTGWYHKYRFVLEMHCIRMHVPTVRCHIYVYVSKVSI
jgi:hypothetical protein